MATIRCLDHTFEAVQAVLFDKDGTLAAVEGYLRKLGEMRSQFIADLLPKPKSAQLRSAMLATFGLFPNRLDPAGLLAVGSRYDNEIAAAACLAAMGTGWVTAVEQAKAAFVQAETSLAPKVQKTPLIAGADTLLTRLSLSGLKIGIVSSDLHSEVSAFIKYYQLHEVNWYCGAAPGSLPKTHPDFLAYACQSLAVDPQKTLVIGDSAADYMLSCQGAMGFLGMTGGWHHPPSIDPSARTFSYLRQVEVFN